MGKGTLECADPRLGRLAPGQKIGDQPVDLRQLVLKIGQACLAGARAVIGQAGRHRPHLARGKAGGDHVADAPRPPQIGGGVIAIAVQVARRFQQPGIFIVAQAARTDPQMIGGVLDLHSSGPFANMPSPLTLVSRSRGFEDVLQNRGLRAVTLLLCLELSTAHAVDPAGIPPILRCNIPRETQKCVKRKEGLR